MERIKQQEQYSPGGARMTTRRSFSSREKPDTVNEGMRPGVKIHFTANFAEITLEAGNMSRSPSVTRGTCLIQLQAGRADQTRSVIFTSMRKLHDTCQPLKKKCNRRVLKDFAERMASRFRAQVYSLIDEYQHHG